MDIKRNTKGSTQITFTIPRMLFDRLEAAADENDTTMHVILNQLISDYVNGMERVVLQDLDDRLTKLEEFFVLQKHSNGRYDD